ncbi:unnamed protein product [Strongylus vulgaris]|uniref:Endonuclease/exonuclease/phosphatase domain-containing protein n=1 Tax=Strongylus vulgaris TaxID=40348 RepID=A0A3P7LMU9_STRVU|nr:unnamed protein product [Strongylus vulgaris]
MRSRVRFSLGYNSCLRFQRQAYHQEALRLATINVGTLTGRHRELADVLRRRRVDIACIQETNWKGGKSRDIGDGYKLLYNGTSSSRNGIVDRLSNRLMSIKIDTGRKVFRIVTAYAPQSGCKEEEKNMFWWELDDYITSIPQVEVLLLGADGGEKKWCGKVLREQRIPHMQ